MSTNANTTVKGFMLRKAGKGTRTYVAGFDYDFGRILGSSKYDALVFATKDEAERYATDHGITRHVQVIRLVERKRLAPNPMDQPTPARQVEGKPTISKDEARERALAKRAARKARG